MLSFFDLNHYTFYGFASQDAAEWKDHIE